MTRSVNLFVGLGLLLLLESNNLIVAHGAEQGDGVRLARLEGSLNFAGKVVGIGGQAHILAAVTLVVHESDEAIVGNIDQGVLLSHHVGDVAGVGGGNDIFVLLSSEDIDGREVALRVAVLSGLGGRHGSHLLTWRLKQGH